MSENSGSGSSNGKPGGLAGGLESLRSAASKNPASQHLLEEVESFLGAQAQRALGNVGEKVGQTTRKLADVASGDAEPGSLLGRTAKNVAEGESPGKAALKGAVGGVKDKVKGALGMGGKGSSSKKSMNIVEDIDIGVPVRVAYNRWTQFGDFAQWSKGVQSVNTEDEVKSNWNAKVALSKRNWTANITEQIPDKRIVWKSSGPKGTVDGVVTFHELGENLTKVLMVLEYHPGGLFEKTANLWRAQGRRARLDLKLFRRFVMLNDEEVEGWRGEIRDGDVARDPDEVARDEAEQNGDGEYEEGEEPEDEYDDDQGDEEDDEDDEGGEPEDEYDDYEEGDEGEEEPEDEYEEGEEPEDEYEDEYDEEEDEEPQPPPRRRRARAGSRG